MTTPLTSVSEVVKEGEEFHHEAGWVLSPRTANEILEDDRLQTYTAIVEMVERYKSMNGGLRSKDQALDDLKADLQALFGVEE